jgi:uncharacterized paraquat-inducible protein A
MALLGIKHFFDDEFYIYKNLEEDLFSCKDCDIEFGLESEKIKGKTIVCPVCKKQLKRWGQHST